MPSALAAATSATIGSTVGTAVAGAAVAGAAVAGAAVAGATVAGTGVVPQADRPSTSAINKPTNIVTFFDISFSFS